MKFATFKELTRIEHTLFGLPFILGGASLGFYENANYQYAKLLWILPAFLSARIAGMALNQLIDHKIDKLNPRTQHRAIPSGRASKMQAASIGCMGLFAFLFICLQINMACALLAPFAVLLLLVYSFMKRIHLSSHFVLGMIHFLGPFMAFVAIKGSFSWAPFFLGLAAFCKISGDDILYALQDRIFDKKYGLKSIPARIGITKSIYISSFLHACTIGSVVALGIVANFPFFYFLLAPVLGYIFYYFHSNIRAKLKESSSPGIDRIFFLANASSSLLIGMFTFLMVLWPVT